MYMDDKLQNQSTNAVPMHRRENKHTKKDKRTPDTQRLGMPNTNKTNEENEREKK